MAQKFPLGVEELPDVLLALEVVMLAAALLLLVTDTPLCESRVLVADVDVCVLVCGKIKGKIAPARAESLSNC